MKLYFDGGCTPNPGRMEAAVVSDDGQIKVHNKELGRGTNNEAEWVGFLWAVGIAESSGFDNIEILGDSKLVIMQAQGLWKCNVPMLRGYLAHFQEMRPSFTSLKLTHVRRNLNLAGIFIEKLQNDPNLR